jgi:pimeloyl-ACP methyl ester carboxylesterase
VSDLEAVVEAAGLTRFALLGISQGCAYSIAYAVRHPERVSHLVLYGGFALGPSKRPRTEAEKEAFDAMTTLMRVGWGQQNAAFRQMFTSLFMPGATKEQADWFNELQRISISPEMAVRNREVASAIDVAALLPQVSAPTLVLHARDDALIRFELGRRMAAGIPGARFVALPGCNHLFLETEPAFGQFLEHPGRSSPPRRLGPCVRTRTRGSSLHCLQPRWLQGGRTTVCSRRPAAAADTERSAYRTIGIQKERA